MGLTSVLEDEAGEELERVEDPTNILHRLLPRHDDTAFVFLGAIDWYGDTVFNHIQIPRFLEEWRRAAARASDSSEIEIVKAIERMAERVAAERLYLKFYGD